MSPIHFNKLFFINTLKTNNNSIVFSSTTIALMLTLLLQGSIQGNLKPQFFVYAAIVSIAFYIWAIIDTKYRRTANTDKELNNS